MLISILNRFFLNFFLVDYFILSFKRYNFKIFFKKRRYNMIKYFIILITFTVASFSLDQINIAKFNNNLSDIDLNKEFKKSSKSKLVTIINKKISTPKDIMIFEQKNKIKPINYTTTVSLKKLEVSEKKKKFFHMMLPAVLISKHKFKVRREKVKKIMNLLNPDEEDLAFMDSLYKKYKTTDDTELLSRMKTHPVSIVLAQAAIESGWGESRFFKEGKNIFGMWSYRKDEPRIKAGKSRNGKYAYVRKYKSLSASIDSYFETIGRGAYKSFREEREITANPLELVKYLKNYCELREKYTKKLKKLIIKNNLQNFDDCEIDSRYI